MITACDNPILYLFFHIARTIGLIFFVLFILTVISEVARGIIGFIRCLLTRKNGRKI